MKKKNENGEVKKGKYISSGVAWRMCQEVGLDIVMLTLLRWIEYHPEIGFQPAYGGCKWVIDRERFMAFIHYDEKTVDKKIFMSLQSALYLLKTMGIPISISTLNIWVKKYNELHPDYPMGVQFQFDGSGQWWVYKKVFDEEFLHVTNNSNK